MAKQIIKITEQDVNRIIKASVCNALRESNESELSRDLESAVSKGNFDVEVNESYEMLVTIYGDYANYYIDATVDVNGSEDSYDWSIVNVEHVSIMGEDDDEEYPMNYVPSETVLSQISSSQKAEEAVSDAYQKNSEWNGWKEFEYDK